MWLLRPYLPPYGILRYICLTKRKSKSSELKPVTWFVQCRSSTFFSTFYSLFTNHIDVSHALRIYVCWSWKSFSWDGRWTWTISGVNSRENMECGRYQMDLWIREEITLKQRFPPNLILLFWKWWDRRLNNVFCQCQFRCFAHNCKRKRVTSQFLSTSGNRLCLQFREATDGCRIGRRNLT